LSRVPISYDKARDMIAALITQHHGEYVFQLGAQPSRAKLFSDSEATDDPGWTGTSRTVQELDALRNGVTKLVEEVGGKVLSVFP
jgi:hypothetical protein